MKRIKIYILSLMVAFSAIDCQKQKADHAVGILYTCPMHPQVIQDHPGQCPICGMDLVRKGEATKDLALMLTESQIRLGNISTMPARREPFGESILTSAKLAIDEEKTIVVSARVGGRLEKLYYKEEGKLVPANVPLYQIYSEQLLTYEQEYLLAVRQWEELKQPRHESFLKAAEKKLLLLGLTREQVTALRESGKADAHVVFLSPVSGTLSQAEVKEGQYVSEGNPLYRIQQLDELWVEAELYGNEIPDVHMGQEVKVSVAGFESRPGMARVTFIGPEYRKGGQILTVRAVLPNPEGIFRPGMYATTAFMHETRNVISLPSDAVVRDAQGNHIWVLDTDGAFRPREVGTGQESDERIEITEGLSENENVVISGAYLLTGEWVLKKGAELPAHQHQDQMNH
ncbi:MAG: efflux RND transporter periplasmic adaptor subunit [Bacteroidetes bacterium]|nr:efflux RND transporter periplasmic adaptor subunit [Bacteroidota bacterium]